MSSADKKFSCSLPSPGGSYDPRSGKISTIDSDNVGKCLLVRDTNRPGLQEEKTCKPAKHGYLPVLQKLWDERESWNRFTCANAAKDGQLLVLQWLRANGCEWDENTCSYAAVYQRYAVLRWAWANGCPCDQKFVDALLSRSGQPLLHTEERSQTEYTTGVFSKDGYLPVLQKLWGERESWNEWTCASAAKEGNLLVLQWLQANGCPWDSWTCAYAAWWGHLSVLQWARANGCPVNQQSLEAVLRARRGADARIRIRFKKPC